MGSSSPLAPDPAYAHQIPGPPRQDPEQRSPHADRISYGGTTGRVDADLWSIIGCGRYWQATGDEAFLEAVLLALERVQFLLEAWEFNNRGLLYVPQPGDWADDFLHNGYVFYDQLLYLRAHWEQAALAGVRMWF